MVLQADIHPPRQLPSFPGAPDALALGFQGILAIEFRGPPGWLPAQDIFLPVSVSEGREVNKNKEHKQWIHFISLFEQQEIGLFLEEMDLYVK